MWFHALITTHDSWGRPRHGVSSLHYNRHFHHKQQPWCKRHIARTLQEKMCREKLYTEKRTQHIAKKMDIALFINSYRTMVSLHSHKRTHTHKKKRLYSDWDKQWFKMHTFTLAILLKKHGPCQTKKNKSKPSPKEKQTGPHMAPYNCYRTSPKSNYFFTHWLLQTSRGNLRKQDDTGGERKKQTNGSGGSFATRHSGTPIPHVWAICKCTCATCQVRAKQSLPFEGTLLVSSKPLWHSCALKKNRLHLSPWRLLPSNV